MLRKRQNVALITFTVPSFEICLTSWMITLNVTFHLIVIKWNQQGQNFGQNGCKVEISQRSMITCLKYSIANKIEITYTAICSVVLLEQLKFALVIFLNCIIPNKINTYSKIFIVNDSVPELMLVFKLFHLYVFKLWCFETLICVFKPHFISYSQNMSHLQYFL